MILRSFTIEIYILFNIFLLCQGLTKDGLGFGYQESEEEDPAKQNAFHKRPVDVPSKCNEGELYYPGDQGDDWVCDCKPGYVYYPAENKCYAAFKKGPCREHEYLVLYNSTVIPVCVQNPCRHENWVRFRNSCYELGKPGPCPVPELSNVIGVNETTLEVICTKGYSYNEVLSQRLGAENNNEEPEYHNKKECFIGGIRWSSERCPQQNFDKNVASIFATS